MSFIFFAAAMALAALALALLPFIRRRKKPGVAGSITALAVPVFAVMLYAWLGHWPVPAPQSAGTAPESMPSIEEMVAGLARRMAAEPDNLEGWIMLGRSYAVLGRFAAAEQAYAHALELAGANDPGLLASYAEAMVLADGDKLTTQAAPLFERVLTLDPQNPKGLWYGGLAAQERGEAATAAQRFRLLLDQDPPPELRAIIEERLVEERLAQAGAVARQPDGGTATGAVAVSITLDQTLAQHAPPNAVLFVYARAPGGGGPPLAVRRLNAAELPLTITLSDADAMMPGTSLAGQSELLLGARISTSGSALRASGDLLGEIRYRREAAGDSAARIVIDTIVP